jgi:hypothetical protein
LRSLHENLDAKYEEIALLIANDIGLPERSREAYNACFRFPPGSSASACPSSFTHGKAAPLVLRQTRAAVQVAGSNCLFAV